MVKSFASLAGAFLLAASSVSGAYAQGGITHGPSGDQLTADDGTVVDLPACKDSAGAPVRFHLKSGKGGWMAFSSFTPMTGPVVELNRAILKEPGKVLRFVAEHECAHHRLGHIRKMFMNYASKNQMPAPAEQKANELAADCAAVPELQSKYGYAAADIRDIFSAFPANDHSATHPPTRERVTNALKCMVKAP